LQIAAHRGASDCWPASRLRQVGEVESSKSAMNTLAPEFSALMTIFGRSGR
jgi:hypothetical protein